MQIKDISAIAGTWVSIVAAAAGAFFALQAYQADIQTRRTAVARQTDERVLASLRLAEDYHRADMIQARSRLRDQLARRTNACTNTAETTANPYDVFAVVEFFDRAKLCADAGLCDRGSLTRLVEPYASTLHVGLAYHVRLQQTEHPGYGSGIADFADEAAHREAATIVARCQGESAFDGEVAYNPPQD
jgi:hypothetical protein